MRRGRVPHVPPGGSTNLRLQTPAAVAAQVQHQPLELAVVLLVEVVQRADEVLAGAEITAEIPEEWLRKGAERFFSPEELAKLEALGWDKLLETLRERLKARIEQRRAEREMRRFGYTPEKIQELLPTVRKEIDKLIADARTSFEDKARDVALSKLQAQYEAAWSPVLEALHAAGALGAPVKLSRLLILKVVS